MTKIKHGKPALRRICTPLFRLAVLAPITAGLASRAMAQSCRQPRFPRAAPTPDLAGRRVEDVRILGNTTVSYTIIRNLIRTKTGDRFDPATVQDDYQRIFDLKKFANVEAKVEPTDTAA